MISSMLILATIATADVRYVTTGYCICSRCCGRQTGITASGRRAVGKMIAGPPSMRFGTTLQVPGYGTARVWDRGGAIKGRRLDLLFPSHKAALMWGRRAVNITVIRRMNDDVGRKAYLRVSSRQGRLQGVSKKRSPPRR